MLNSKSDKKNNEKRAIIAVALIMTALGVLAIPQMQYFGIVAFVIYMFKFSDLDNYKLCLLLIPMIRIFDGIGITFIVNILLVLPAFIMLVKHKTINIHALRHTGILVFWELLHIFIFDNMGNLLPNISAILPLLFCESLISDKEDISLDTASASRWLAMGSIISAAIYLLDNRDYFNNVVYSVIDGLRFTAYADDPNYYSVYIVMAIIGLLANPNHKATDFILIISLAAIGMLTASKMCLIMMIISFLIYISGYLVSNAHENKRFIGKLLTIAIGMTIIFGNKITLLFGNFINRLVGKSSNFTLDTATTGRSQLAIRYFIAWLDDPMAMLFGYGFQYRNFFDIALHNRNYTSGAHNTYLDVMLSWGLLGLIIVGFIVWRMIKESKPNTINIKGGIAKYPFVALSMMLIALSCLNAGMFWFIISFPMIINMERSDNNCSDHGRPSPTNL
jgi:hypothetical protein